jgi:hypothetical protein
MPVNSLENMAATSSSSSSSTSKLSKSAKHQRVIICGGGIIGASIAYYLTVHHGITSVTIIEQTSIACGASGRAGGFLAQSWCDNNDMKLLAQRSFFLHFQLPSMLTSTLGSNVDTGYRGVTTIGLHVKDPHVGEIDDAVSHSSGRKPHELSTTSSKDSTSSPATITTTSSSSSAAAETTATPTPTPTSTAKKKFRVTPPSWVDGDSITRVKSMGGPTNTAQCHPRLTTEALIQVCTNHVATNHRLQWRPSIQHMLM